MVQALNISQELPSLGRLADHLEHSSLEMHSSATSTFFDDLARSAAASFQYPQMDLAAQVSPAASAATSVASIIGRAPEVGGEKAAAQLLTLRLRTELDTKQLEMKLPLLQLYVKKALSGILAARSELDGPSWDSTNSTLRQIKDQFCATPVAAALERSGDSFDSWLESVITLAPMSTALHDSSGSINAARSELATLSDAASLRRCTTDHRCNTRVEHAVQGAVRELDANMEFLDQLRSMLMRYDIAGSRGLTCNCYVLTTVHLQPFTYHYALTTVRSLLAIAT